MNTAIEDMKIGAQETLDELFSQHLIPFELSARVVDSIGLEEYIVRFHDSPLRSVDLSFRQDQCFKDVFRAAVLQRVKRLGDPLHNKTAR